MMQLPLLITFKGMPESDAIVSYIRARARRLDHFHARIMSCRVVVEESHQHHAKGKLYSARVDVTFPGGEVVVSREAGRDQAHDAVHVSLRDAFDAVTRRLQDHVRMQRGKRTSSDFSKARILLGFNAPT